MKIKKQDLSFLNIYAQLSDSKAETNKIVSLEIKNNVATFYMKSTWTILITKIPVESEKDFSTNFGILQFLSLIKTVKDDAVIKVKEQSIVLYNNKNQEKAELSFNVISFNIFDDFSDKLELLEKPAMSIVSLKELDKLSGLKKFASTKEMTLDVIGLNNNMFFASDTKTGSIVKTSNELTSLYYLPRVIVNTFEKLKLTEIEIKLYENYSVIVSDKTSIFIKNQNYKLPDFSLDENKKIYDMKEGFEIDYIEAEEFATIASSINNPAARVFMTIKKDYLLVESKEGSKSHVKIPIKNVHSDLIGKIFSLNYTKYIVILDSVKKIWDTFEEKEDKSIYITYRDKAICIKDKNEKNIFFQILMTMNK